jgi:hypothetical protein
VFDPSSAALQVRIRSEDESTIVELFAAFYTPLKGPLEGEIELLGAPVLTASDFILNI